MPISNKFLKDNFSRLKAQYFVYLASGFELNSPTVDANIEVKCTIP